MAVKRTTIIGFFLCLTLSMGSAFAGLCYQDDEKSIREKELKKLDEEINTYKKEIEALENDRKTTVRFLEQLKMQRQIHLREIRKLSLRIKEADKKISVLEVNVEELTNSINLRKEDISKILRRIYMTGGRNILKSLLAIKSTKDIGLAHTYLSYIARKDLEMLIAYKKDVDTLKNRQNDLDEEKSNLIRIKKDEEEHYSNAEESRKEQEKILSQIRSKTGVYQQSLREKLDAKKELEKIIEQLGESSTFSNVTTFSTLLGRLPWPVEGEIIENFGTVRDRIYDVEIENDGIDIKASIGTPVKAVADGKVVLREWFDVGGNMVVLEHGNGYYTLYAHLSRFDVAIEEDVKAGQIIGAVGETGSLKGPVLRFEIRQVMKGRKQRALDPAKWLRNTP